ncbi:MAG: diaminopimelate epimerase [Lachnospiraceae bacterium]|nr:diaminopimelate epimerase [Lachnospiraceae bacterium]
MKFTKMQGIGNDYVYINGFEEKFADHPGMSVKVSDRHFGIGSDGLIIINPSDKADFEMEMYNADGSRSEMCGNGIRCVGKFVYDKGLTDKTEITVDTLAGVKKLKLFTENGRVKSVTVDMGEPILKAEDIPVNIPGISGDTEKVVSVPIEVKGKEYKITCVSMGNPHGVVFVPEDPGDLNLEALGPDFENHAYFPNRVNTEFIYVKDRKNLIMRVWERGSGETFACGTGACASLVAAVLNGLSDREVDIKLLGGTLHIKWDEDDGHVYMTGPAETVFEGDLEESLVTRL